MRISNEMVNRVAEAMADVDWLPPDWDASFDDSRCPLCGSVRNGDGDGGDQIRALIREFLRVALEGDS